MTSIINEPTKSIYVVTCRSYSERGFFKIRKTKKMTRRDAPCNVNRPVNDKFYAVLEVKTYDVEYLIERVDHYLHPFKSVEHRTFYRVPYKTLVNIINIVNTSITNDEILRNEIRSKCIIINPNTDREEWIFKKNQNMD